MSERVRARMPNYYSRQQLLDLLNRAEALGYSLDVASPLEEMTVRELEQMVVRGEARGQREDG